MNLRLQPSLKAAAEKAAAEDRRSLTGLVEKLLVDHLSALPHGGARKKGGRQ